MSDVRDREEFAVQEERLSELCGAFLRINESLDLDSVLQEVLDSARALTGAQVGVIVQDSGQQRTAEFLYSGMTPEQAVELGTLPNRWELFDHFYGVEKPLRLDDLQSYLNEHELSEFSSPVPLSPPTAYLGAQIRYQDQRVGAIFMAEKEGGFSVEDEETLVMFSSQAALVISNARRYRQEQRARADLEALVNIAPMAVLIFEAESGELSSVNEEAIRIIGDLGLKGDSLHDIVSAATYRRADGRVISKNGIPLEETMNTGETVWEEEIIIEFPSGREFVAVVNATPIRGADGEVESVIVTAQDLAPLAELERQRTEFLGIVGHELRSPLTAIKGSTSTLLEGQFSLDPAEMIEYHRMIDEQADYMRDLINNLTDIVRIESGSLSVNPVPLELVRLVDEARNVFLSTGGREHIRIDLPSDLPW